MSSCTNTLIFKEFPMKGKSKVAAVMSEYKKGKLHAGVNPKGPKKAPLAKSRKQAIAIALRVAGVPKKAKKGGK